MSVVLDGERVESSGDTRSLDLMRDLLRRSRRVPTRLTVNGKEVALDRLAGLSPAEAEVELETVTLESAVENAYDEAGRHLARLEDSIERCCEALMLGRLKEAMEDFSGLCLGLEGLFALMLPLDSLVGVSPSEAWSAMAEGMKPLLLATSEAVALQDWVLVGDQLRYEWSPQLRLCGERLPRARAEAARRALAAAEAL